MGCYPTMKMGIKLHMTNDNHFFRKPNVGRASRLSSERVSASVKGKNKESSPTSSARAGETPSLRYPQFYEGRMIHQFDAKYSPGNYAVVEKEVREELLRKELYRLAKLIRQSLVLWKD